MQVLEQINKLLHPSDPETQREANNYLTKWQRTIEAWAESHTILSGNFPPETLRVKILYDFYQLPADVVVKICESLLSCLNQEGLPRNISSTVGLAVCDMAIQMADSWDSPVDSFTNYYKSNRLSLETVLFLLETLPAETSNNRLILIPELHTKVTIKLKSEYVKVVEFLSVVRNNLTQLAANMKPNPGANGANANVLNYKLLGKILKVWNNWRRFDTFSGSADLCRSFLKDCLEIIKNPSLRNEGLDEEIYETAVDCMVELLQECSYLTHRERAAARDDSDDDTPTEVSLTRYNDLIEVQKACFNALAREMNAHLVEAFRTRDVFLFNNVSRLFANLADSVTVDHNSADPDLILLLDYLVKLVELPYLLLYADTTVSDMVNPFMANYNHVKAREVVVNALLNLKGGALFDRSARTRANGYRTRTLDLDDEACNVSQKAVYVIADLLSKFTNTLSAAIADLTSVNMLTTTTPGLFPYVLSSILQLLLLVSVPPHQLYFALAESDPEAERVNYVEFVDNYNYYVGEVMDLYYDLLRVVNKRAVFDYVRANVLNLPNFANSPLLIQSAFVLLPPALVVAPPTSAPNPALDAYRAESVKAVGQLVVIINNLIAASESSFGAAAGGGAELLLLATLKIGCVRFLGQIKRVFALPGTQDMLRQVLLILTRHLTLGAGTPGREAADAAEVYDKLRYESGHSVSLVCCQVKMDTLTNNQEILTILLSSLDAVDNELLIVILEGLAISCYNLNRNDLLVVFNQVISSTLNQLAAIVQAAQAQPTGHAQGIGSANRLAIIKLTNRIVGFVRNLRNRPELDPIVGERIFPVLLSLLQLFYLDNDLVEVTCRCIKHNARVLDVHFSKYIPALVQTISKVAQVKMFGTYLYLIEWLHSIFYAGPRGRGPGGPGTPHARDEREITALYTLLTTLTLNIFKSLYHSYPPSPNAGGPPADPPEENELLIEDFYGLQAEFFMSGDTYLNDLAIVNDIISCSCRFIFIRRPQCVFYFWESLLKTSRDHPHIAGLTGQYLQTVLANCFLKLGHACNRPVEHYIESLVTGVMAFVRSPALQGLPGLANGSALRPGPGDREKYIELLLSNALNNLPVEIISNDRLRASFLAGLVAKTKSTVSHIYKLSAKLSMRNRF